MKTLILWILVLTIAYVSNAQYVNIPDTAFLNALIEAGVDTSGDGEISYAEAKAVTSLHIIGEFMCEMQSCVTFGNISELTGIEAFINLDSLFIQGNHIDSIDLSMNKDLYYLYCCYNNLTSLDLSKNTALTELYCYNNQLHSLDVSNNTALSRLECDHNGLTSLDVSNNTALTYLSCISNPLTSLDVSNNIALKYLSCRAYGFEPGQLTSLDVSGCTALEYLDCYWNQLTSLDVSNNTALSWLVCDNNQLTSLDVSNNTALTLLSCTSNQLTSLDVSNNTELVDLDLRNMPTLYEVCVWESFPAGVDVDTSESPNVQFTTDCAVNIPNEYTVNSTMNIYPNPSDNIINIEIRNPDNSTIEIYNVSGRLVFSKALNSKVEKIDISELSEGMYFVKVRQENNVRVEKLIVY